MPLRQQQQQQADGQELRQRYTTAPGKQASPAAAAAAAGLGAKPRAAETHLVGDRASRLKQLWLPSYSVAFRIIILVRTVSAMHSGIADCDEVYNYWEPLHLLLHRFGLQTWEYSPEYGIRSYAYLLLHLPFAWFGKMFSPLSKRPTFFIVRFVFALVSSAVEADLYHSAATHLSPRIGRYILFILLCSAGMFSASVSFLPSSFAMLANMFAISRSLATPNDGNPLVRRRRSLSIVLAYAFAAVVAWPFAGLLAIPFAVEHFLVAGRPAPEAGWRFERGKQLFIAAAASATLLIPVVSIDSVAYRQLTVVPLNIVKYNIFAEPGKGPTLYGTESPLYYLLNGALAFNIILPMALVAAPAILLTAFVDRRRYGSLLSDKVQNSSSILTVLFWKIAPLYVWLAVITAQPHKEERFLYPIYGHIALAAAITLFLARGWFETAFIKVTKSPYRATQTVIFTTFTRSVLFVSSVLSIARIFAIYHYYHAPMGIYDYFAHQELARVAVRSFPDRYPALDPTLPERNFTIALEKAPFQMDLSMLAALDLRLCVGSEWHRFPSHFFVPSAVDFAYVKSDFDGILPRKWQVADDQPVLGGATAVVPPNMNDMNREEADRYVDIETCDYLVDLDFPHRANAQSYVQDKATWEALKCLPFLDAEASPRLTRVLWLPVEEWQSKNVFGDYCLLKRRV